ncbi:MAG: response regulator, partial [Pelobacteraceae bacterium]
MPEVNLSYSDISLLYVEDEAATREQVSRVLAARGYRLTVAEDGEQGLKIFRELAPDIVLTDIMMPRLNGLEMAREIRALSPEIQIACMTAFSDTGYLIDAIDIG